MDKKVFISHSQKDKAIADIICDALEKESIGCWIAPRDIPYGNDWAGEITKAIESCALFIFILSEHSNASRQCPKEISIADNANIPIVCIKIDDAQMNPGFKYHLSMQQTFFLDVSKIKEKLSSVVEAIQNKVYGREKSDNEQNFRYNVDTELDELFQRTFEERTEESETTVSKAKKKLFEIQESRFFSNFEEKIPQSQKESTDDISDVYQVNEYEYTKDSLRYSDETKEYLSGKHFCIPTLPGMNIAVFQVCEDLVDYKTLTKYIAFKNLELLVEEESEKATVYLDTVHSEGVSMIILYIDFENGKIFVNMGLLLNDSVKISKKPMLMSFKKSYLPDDDSKLNDTFYVKATTDDEIRDCIKLATGDELAKLDEHWVNADFRLSPAVVLDPETALPVLREVYYDEKAKCQRSKMKITSHKSYFAMQLNITETESTSVPLSSFEKGEYYRKGYHGFPKNLPNAIDYLEEDGSPEAMYEIALIFDRENDCKDEDTYLEYLVNAANNGCEKAFVELVLRALFVKHSEESLTKYFPMLLDCLDEKSGVGNYIAAYVSEYKNDEQSAFNYYLKAAQNEYRPALVRLQCLSNEIESLTKEEIYKRYTQAKDEHPGLSYYCMGKICYYGIGIEPLKFVAVELFEKAASLGNIDSQYSLFEIYDSDCMLQDKAIALMWLEKVAESTTSVFIELANRYIDGIGCKQSSENDKKAFALLESLDLTNNKTAINNLAWLYKNGRGCAVDYIKSKKLFEKAAELGCSTSYYHLGTLYEDGLGVDRDIAKAVELYHIASDNGNKKATEKLKMLSESNL